jgi:hypothetical protein
MASPIDDPRYALARLMRSERQSSGSGLAPLGPAPSRASVALGRTASNMAASNPSLREAIDRIQSGQGGAAPQRGLAGAVLGNPIAKVGLNALTALTIPGKAIVAGLREGVDAIDANPETKASFGDLRKNIKDPKFGFGTAFNIDTGSKWLDRAIGFVGDVALDPLTYATFGAGQFAGQAGRLSLANVVLKNTGDARLANQIQRFGRAAIKDPAILEAAGANRHGLYFLGKRIKVGQNKQGLRLPGSGAIGQLGDNALAKLRISAMGTKGGQFIQKITLPGEAGAARQALLQGKVGDEAAAVAIGALSASPTGRKAAGVALQAANRELLEKMQRAELAGFDSYSKELYKYIENPSLLEAAPKQIQDAYEEWSTGFFGRYEDDVAARMAEVDPNHKWTGLKNYFPRVQTDEALSYAANPANTYARSIREIMGRDPLSGGNNFKTRTMEVGDDWFGVKLTEEDLGSVERLNGYAREHLGGADFFETDLRIVAPKYVASYADEVGLLAKHKHLADTGVWKRAEAVELGEEFLDKELVGSIKKSLKSLTDELNESYKQSSRAYLGLTDEFDKLLKSKQDELAAVVGNKQTGLAAREALIEADAAIDDVLRGSLTMSADTLQTVVDNLGSLKNKFAGFFGAKVVRGAGNRSVLIMHGTDEAAKDVPMVLDGLVGYLDDLELDVSRLADEMRVVEKDLTGAELRALKTKSEEGLKSAQTRLNESRKRVETIMEFGNQIESAFETIARGEDVGDLPHAVNEILAIVARDGDLSNSTVDQIKGKVLGADKALEKFIKAETKKPGGLFKSLTQEAEVNDAAVSAMEISTFYNDIPGIFSNEHSLTHVREMALYALLRDERLYGGQVPELIAKTRNELIDQLQRADATDAYLKQLGLDSTTSGRRNSASVFENEWRNAFSTAERMRDDAASIEEFVTNFRAGLAGSEDVLDDVVNWDAIAPQYDKYPWLQSLEPTGTRFDEIEELMGAREVLPTRSNQDFTTAGGTLDIRGESFAEGQFSAKPSRENITYRELLSEAENLLGASRQALSDTEFFEFGSGATARKYTGNEVLGVKSQLDNLNSEISRMRKARTAAQEQFKKDKGYDKLDLSVNSKNQPNNPRDFARSKTIELEAKNIWQSKDAADRYTELLNRRNKITGGGSMVRPAWFADATAEKGKLGDALLNYHIVSEVFSRWSALSEYSSVFGFAPSQRQFADLTAAVGEKFMPIIDRELASTHSARGILQRLDKDIAVALGERPDGVRANQIFKKFVDGLSDPERDVLESAIGTKVLAEGDAYSLRRGLNSFTKSKLGDEAIARRSAIGKELKALPSVKNSTPKQVARRNALNKELGRINATSRTAQNEYLENSVKPWFVSAFPNIKPTKENMIAALKREAPTTRSSAKKQYATPWGDSADPATIKRFFESTIGSSEIAGRGVPKAERMDALHIKIKSLRDAHARFERMLSPDLNIQQFFDDPSIVQQTPTMYAYLLKRTAESLRKRIAVKQGMNFDILDVRTQTNLRAARGAQQAQDVADVAGEYRGLTRTQPPASLIRAIKETEDALGRLNKKISDNPRKKNPLTKSEVARKESLEATLAEQKKQLKAASPAGVPSSVSAEITSAASRQEKIVKADTAVADAQSKLAELREQAKPLRSKKRTKAGLNKTEAKRLAALETKAAKAQDALSAARAARKNVGSLSVSESRAASIPKGADLVEVAERNIDEYNSLMVSPMYSKAKNDEQMVEVMNKLSGFELDQYPNGFITSEGVVATMPGGKPIVFSDSEWRSLFTGVVDREEAAIRRNTARRRIGEIETQITRLVARKTSLDESLTVAEMATNRVQRSVAAVEAAYAEVERIKSLIDDVQGSIDNNIKTRQSLLTDAESFNAAVQSSALAKMRVLVLGRKGQAPVFDRDGISKFTMMEHPTQRAMVTSKVGDVSGVDVRDNILANSLPSSPEVIAKRQEMLLRAWKSSEEYKILQKLSDIEQDTFVKMYKFMDESVEETQRALVEIESKLRNMIEDPEMAELGASIRNIRSDAQMQAQAGADVLKVETGRVPVSAAGEELPIPRTPAEMDAYSASLAQQAKPTSPRFEPTDQIGKLPEAGDIEAKIAVKAEEMNQLAQLNDAGQLDPKGYRRMISLEKQIADLDRDRLKIANLIDARAEMIQAEQGIGVYTEGLERANAALAGWDAPRVDPVTGAKLPSLKTASVAEAKKAWQSRVARTNDVKAVVRALEERKISVMDKMAVMSGSVDNFWQEVYKQRGIVEGLRQEISEIEALIKTMPPDDARRTLRSIAAKSGRKVAPEQVESTLRAYRKWAGENERVFQLLAENPDDPVYKAWAAAGVADAHMIDLELTKPQLLNDLLNASTPVWKTTVVDTFEKTYQKAAEASGMLQGMKRVDARLFPSLYGNSEALDLLKSIDRIREPGVADDLSRFMRGYTGFFKSYATLSPGFHVRNGISNMFAIFSAGADFKNMREGFRLWRLMDDAISKGTPLESWLKSLPVEQQDAARVSAETMLGIGAGKTDNAMEGFVRSGSTIRDNRMLDTSRTAGQKLEGSARFMLAYDSTVKGMAPDEVFNRTRRYLIDYNEKSILDEAMRDIIPFWTWMSRNLPLQIVNRWANPKPYLMYEKAVRNFQEDLQPGEVTPGYLSAGGAINLGGSKYLVPDLPFSRIEDQVSDLTNPSAMLGYVNPGLKTPLEMVFNKNTFTDRNFDNKFVPVKGYMMALLPALQAAGQVEYNAKGEPMVREKAAYAVNSMIPFMGRADRLSAGGTQGENARNAFLGIPVRTASQGSQDSERYARLAQLQAMEDRRKNLGG